MILNERGNVSLSMNAIGTTASSGSFRIEKPAGATLRRAVLFAATTGFTGYRLDAASPITADATPAMGPEVPSNMCSYNYRTDVTATADKVNAAPPVMSASPSVSPRRQEWTGPCLTLIFDDPSVPTTCRSVRCSAH